ncbi:MAG: S8/S53 family peptidase [Candidatus Melainabacteria bacterium]
MSVGLAGSLSTTAVEKPFSTLAETTPAETTPTPPPAPEPTPSDSVSIDDPLGLNGDNVSTAADTGEPVPDEAAAADAPAEAPADPAAETPAEQPADPAEEKPKSSTDKILEALLGPPGLEGFAIIDGQGVSIQNTLSSKNTESTDEDNDGDQDGYLISQDFMTSPDGKPSTIGRVDGNGNYTFGDKTGNLFADEVPMIIRRRNDPLGGELVQGEGSYASSNTFDALNKDLLADPSTPTGKGVRVVMNEMVSDETDPISNEDGLIHIGATGKVVSSIAKDATVTRAMPVVNPELEPPDPSTNLFFIEKLSADELPDTIDLKAELQASVADSLHFAADNLRTIGAGADAADPADDPDIINMSYGVSNAEFYLKLEAELAEPDEVLPEGSQATPEEIGKVLNAIKNGDVSELNLPDGTELPPEIGDMLKTITESLGDQITIPNADDLKATLDAETARITKVNNLRASMREQVFGDATAELTADEKRARIREFVDGAFASDAARMQDAAEPLNFDDLVVLKGDRRILNGEDMTDSLPAAQETMWINEAQMAAKDAFLRENAPILESLGGTFVGIEGRPDLIGELHGDGDLKLNRVLQVTADGMVTTGLKDFDAAAKSVADNGTVVVVSAGNGAEIAKAFGAVDGQDRNFLGRSENVITVGALNPRGTQDATDDTTAVYSAKGDIATSGYAITVDPQDALNGNGAIAGTSFAAPALSGVVAMMKELNPALPFQKIKEILISTGDPTADGQVALDVKEALDAVRASLTANPFAGKVA